MLSTTIISGIALVAIIAFEMRSEEFRRSTFRDRDRVWRNWAFMAAAIIAILMIRRFDHWSEGVLPRVTDFSEFPVIDILGAVLVADLFSYMSHYVKHRFDYLWRFHFQHHIEERYSIWLAAHTHALEVVVSGVILCLLLTVLGFSTFAKQVYFTLYSIVVTYHHSARDYSLGWLDRIVISPAFHRLHHEIGSRSNYGAVLTLFDVLFGTAEWPVTAQRKRYGAGDPRLPFGFSGEMTYFLEPLSRLVMGKNPAPVLQAPALGGANPGGHEYLEPSL